MEENIGGVRPIGQISYLVNHQDVGTGVVDEGLMEMAPLTGVGEIFDKLGGGGEQSLETILDGAVCDGNREMSFATAGFAIKNQRSSLGDEVRSEVGTEQRLPESRLQSEIELIDGLEEGEVRCGCSAAIGFACVVQLLRRAKERGSRDRTNFLFRLDVPPLGRCGACARG